VEVIREGASKGVEILTERLLTDPRPRFIGARPL